jgi:hypothetical protein
MSTSPGFPLSGSKRNWIVELDPKLYPSHQHPLHLDDIFWEEVARIEECYLRGERAYAIFKACPKDEPTLLSSDKVRLFQAAQLAFVLCVRRLYLPIARVLSLFPVVTECAVGVNAHGLEWQELCDYMMKFGLDRVFAGDYSKWDLRLPSQLTLSAFNCMILIAKAVGYSSRDISIMEGIATDVAYPVTAFNGDLIQLLGSGPSGHPLTVYINNIGNSLNQRCAYYGLVKERPLPPFRQYVAISCYGDDILGTVSPLCKEFSMRSVSEYLAKRGFVFTMPDKGKEMVDFMTDGEAEFLKRKSTYIEEIDRCIGALSEDSIFKSLHRVLASKYASPEEQATMNIDGALREWFAHGRKIYETRRQQMRCVATDTNLLAHCSMLTKTFDDVVEEWKSKYVPIYRGGDSEIIHPSGSELEDPLREGETEI